MQTTEKNTWPDIKPKNTKFYSKQIYVNKKNKYYLHTDLPCQTKKKMPPFDKNQTFLIKNFANIAAFHLFVARSIL